MKFAIFILLFLHAACRFTPQDPRIKQWEAQASRVTILRDKWGIPHIYGQRDADAVFGFLYAQCEESFERVERAYIEKLGRLSEIEGEGALADDLQARLLFDTAAAIKDFHESPAWLRDLLQAFADGVHYYLFKHPDVRPKLLTRFEPWFPLLFTDGGYTATQTGGLEAADMQRLYGTDPKRSAVPVSGVIPPSSFNGSNAFAIAPSRSATKNALLYINPHVSLYFRMEAHLVSEEGLNVYGSATWGQFFIFQGFNENCGWMHTSSQADAADLYEETTLRKGDSLYYRYNETWKPMAVRQHPFALKNGNTRTITAFYTHHGPVMGERNGKWLSLKEKNRSLDGLLQSWTLSRAKDLAGFEKALDLRANSSTNTMYADNQGNIAYWHGNFIPVREPQFNWRLPVDGSTTATDWSGTHDIKEIVQIRNPSTGWMQNCNSSPFSISGVQSIKKNYPAYMAPEGENFRSLLAIREMEKEMAFDLDKLIALGYNRYLMVFDSILPPLLQAYERLPVTAANRLSLKEPVGLLASWDRKAAVNSVATTIAVEWAYALFYNAYRTNQPSFNDLVQVFTAFAHSMTDQQKITLLESVITGLEKAYGTWKIPWGEINRYQRDGNGMHTRFDDAKASLPVAAVSALFGCLPAYETVWNGTRKGYGVAGNSFVCAVEFGKRVRAKAISPGGQSFDSASKHFSDQASMYVEGRFRDVLFYKEDVIKNQEKQYHPGEE